MKSSPRSLLVLACASALLACANVARGAPLPQDVTSVAGVVVDASGAPIEGAVVSSMSTTRTDARGAYRLEVPGPGRVLVDVSAPGYAHASTHVDVALTGRTTRVPDIVLLASPRIAGVVVGRGSAALAGVAVEALSTASIRSARAVTDERGAFAIALEEDAPHVVVVRGVPGYFDRGVRDRRAASVRPGTSDLRIVLEPRRPMTFVVVDAATSEPVRVGTVLVEHRARSTVTTQDLDGSGAIHDGSASFDVGAPPASVTVRANPVPVLPDFAGVAYVPFRGPLAPDVDRMTIRLERAGIVRYEADPPSARVDVRAIGADGTSVPVPVDTVEYLAATPGPGRAWTLPPGRYDFHFLEPRHLPRVVRDVVVDPAKPVDLGRIALDPGAVARVRLSLPDGVTPVGLRLRIDDDEERSFENATSPIVFAGLAAGEHELLLLAQPPRVPEERRMTFTIATGQYADVRFLARD